MKSKVEIIEIRTIVRPELDTRNRLRFKVPEYYASFFNLRNGDELGAIVRLKGNLFTIFVNKLEDCFLEGINKCVYVNNSICITNRKMNISPDDLFEIVLVKYEGNHTYCIKLQQLKREQRYLKRKRKKESL